MKYTDLWSFTAGFLSCAIILYLLIFANIAGKEMPTGLVTAQKNIDIPNNRITPNDIKITKDSIIINIKDASISSYAPTGSMKPTLDTGANGIRIQPTNSEDISIGDIVSFKQENTLKVHRVIDKGMDDEGTYYITQGDNTLINDGKIRFEQIKYVTIGVLW